MNQRSDEEMKQHKMRAADKDAQKYGLESILEEERAKDSNNLELFFLHVENEKLKKSSKIDKLIYFYIGTGAGIMSSLTLALIFS